MTRRIETWQLRAKFAAALSRQYGAEVPAYTTLVAVQARQRRCEFRAQLPGFDAFTHAARPIPLLR